MKKSVKIILIVVAVVLALAIVYGAAFFWYYPHYKNNKIQIYFEDVWYENRVAVMSCNVRCFNVMDMGKKSWFYRADLIMQGIQNNLPGVIGFQEVTKWQYDYLTESMQGYDSVIDYRDDAFNSEGCPVFYRTELYELVEKGSFWLSETPDKMSKDWGAACYRICSYVILKDKATAKQFVVFNTHLDHVSDEARINGIQVVLNKIAEFGSIPAILMGDLNAEEDSETYRSATQNFLDVKYQTSNTDSGCTYQKWGEQLDRNCIDYILISKTGFNVLAYKVVDDTYDGVYSSDHFPIFAELSFVE